MESGAAWPELERYFALKSAQRSNPAGEIGSDVASDPLAITT
jgi:hypothetical protein